MVQFNPAFKHVSLLELASFGELTNAEQKLFLDLFVCILGQKGKHCSKILFKSIRIYLHLTCLQPHFLFKGMLNFHSLGSNPDIQGLHFLHS